MTPDEFKVLVDDIRKVGKILVPVAMYRGMILDGRHRLDAAEQAGIKIFDGAAWLAPLQVLPLSIDPSQTSTAGILPPKASAKSSPSC
jgi:ParB-like chromosome segregation protein Spo0J